MEILMDLLYVISKQIKFVSADTSTATDTFVGGNYEEIKTMHIADLF